MSRSVRTFTLSSFNAKAQELYNADDQADFIRFVLRGLIGEEQVFLDPIQNAIGAVIMDPTRVSARRDYDSLIGISKKIEVWRSIWVYPLSNLKDTLTQSIHLEYPVSFPDTGPTHLKMHRIPNLMFAKWDERNMIRIVFPLLASPDRARVTLTKEEQNAFYEKGLRPAIQEVTPRDAAEWPATLRDEMTRARKSSGTISYQTKQIARENVDDVVEAIRRHLDDNGVEWARDFIFLHNVRGTKHGTAHDMSEEGATPALEEYLDELCLSLTGVADDTDDNPHGIWFIDVGLEIYYDMEGRGAEQEPCLQWRSDAHPHVVKHVLDIDLVNANRIATPGSSSYSRDLVSHLTDVSGCRITPGLNAEGRYEACYLQLYTTDKSVTYSPEGSHHGKTFSCKNAMAEGNTYCNSIYEIYHRAMDKNSSHARMEVRVPLKSATSVLTSLDYGLVSRSLVSFDPDVWWGFRAYRLLAISIVLRLQREGHSSLRVHPHALSLTAGCVWFANGLHSRPDDGSAARSLMNAVLPHTPLGNQVDASILAYPVSSYRRNRDTDSGDDSDDQRTADTHPSIPFGAVFLRDFYVPPKSVIPRMKKGPMLSEEAFHYLFSMTEEDLRFKYNSIGIARPGDRPADRVNNKARRTTAYLEPADPVFSLGAMGHALPVLVADGGSDQEDETGDPLITIDGEASAAWRLFFPNTLEKCPNPVGEQTSYCKLTKDERIVATEEINHSRAISDIFHLCQYKVATTEDFLLSFNHAFPAKGHVLPLKTQGYPQSSYYCRWKELMHKLSEGAAKATREQAKEKYLRLFWVPHSTQDKLWPSAYKPGFKQFPKAPDGKGPRILVREAPQ